MEPLLAVNPRMDSNTALVHTAVDRTTVVVDRHMAGMGQRELHVLVFATRASRLKPDSGVTDAESAGTALHHVDMSDYRLGQELAGGTAVGPAAVED